MPKFASKEDANLGHAAVSQAMVWGASLFLT